MLYYMNNTFQNTAFDNICLCAFNSIFIFSYDSVVVLILFDVLIIHIFLTEFCKPIL